MDKYCKLLSGHSVFISVIIFTGINCTKCCCGISEFQLCAELVLRSAVQNIMEAGNIGCFNDSLL